MLPACLEADKRSCPVLPSTKRNLLKARKLPPEEKVEPRYCWSMWSNRWVTSLEKRLEALSDSPSTSSEKVLLDPGWSLRPEPLGPELIMRRLPLEEDPGSVASPREPK